MKFYIITALLITTATAEAQNLVSLFAGPQATTVSYEVNGTKQNTEYKFGFHAGIMMKVPFEGNLFFSPSVFYSLKGYKVQYNQHVYPPDPDASDNNVTLHTFELAGLLQVDLSKDPNHFFVGFGPALDLQIFGNEKFNLMSGGSVDRNMKFGFAHYGRYLTSVIGRFGYENGKGFHLFLQYDLGLGSLNNADHGPVIRHRTIGLSFATVINRKKLEIDTRNRE
jgi:hypothetical protein